MMIVYGDVFLPNAPTPIIKGKRAPRPKPLGKNDSSIRETTLQRNDTNRKRKSLSSDCGDKEYKCERKILTFESSKQNNETQRTNNGRPHVDKYGKGTDPSVSPQQTW